MNPAACMALCLTAEQFSNYQTALLLKYPEWGRPIVESINSNRCRATASRCWYCYLEDPDKRPLSEDQLLQAFELAEDMCGKDELASGQLIVLSLDHDCVVQQQCFGDYTLIDVFKQYAIDHPF